MTNTNGQGSGSGGTAVLVLEDGRIFTGTRFGAVGQTLGEAVFSTGMSGYQETLTDPSYHGQIVIATAPQIGNTGWNTEDGESRGDKIWVAGYAVRDPSPRASNWRASGTLDDELVRQGIVGIAGIDTRAVVRHLRTRGSMKAGVFSGEALADADELLDRVRSQPSMLGADLAGEVSTEASYTVEPEGGHRFTVAAIDLGIKTNTPRNFARRGIRSHVLPSRWAGPPTRWCSATAASTSR
jgi:carbamoyl-phosphate synthase small subunit